MAVLEKLDPFYWFDRFWFRYVGKPESSGDWAVYYVAMVLYAVVVAYGVYIVLGIILHTPKPAVIVASDSMYPTLHRGDIAVVLGVSPGEIRAPEVNIPIPLSNVSVDRAPIDIVYDNGRFIGFNYNGVFIPYEKNGDIVVYFNDIYRRDIIHRAVLKVYAADGVFFLTKGDNDATNPTIDEDCSRSRCIYPYFISSDRVYGKVVFVIPRIGLIKLLLLGG